MFTRVRGNTIQFAMPLQGKTFFAGGIAVYDFVPAETDVITVVMQDRRAYTYTPTVRSNMLLWTDDGNLDVGMYSVEVIVNREDGTQLRCLRINQVNIVETNAESELDFPMVNNSTDETVAPADAGTEETEETVASGEETPTRAIASSDFEETAPSYESDVPLTDGPNERFYPKDILSAGVFIFAGDGTLGIREIAEGVFDSRIIDVEDRLIHDYTSKIAISARELRSDYEEQIYDAKAELTEAYQSEILQTARQISLTVESYKAESDGHYSELSSELLLQSDRIETKVSQEDYDENNILIEERFSNVVQTSEEIRATVVDNKRETDGSIRNLQSQLAITASEIAAKVSLLQYNADKHETDAKFGELIVRSDQISAQVIANKTATDGLIQGLERRLTIDENGISTLVADLNIVGRQVTVAQSEIIQLANSIGLKVNQSDYNVDKQAILQRIASLTVDVDGVHAEVSRVESTVDTHTQTLAQYALDIQDLQSQIDGAIDTWFYDYPPVHVDEHGAPDSTVPLITDSQGRPVQPYYDWYYAETQSEPEKVRDMHLGDIFYDNASGYAYRFEGTGQPGSRVYSWVTIQDSAVITALQNAAKAQDTADHKRRVFVTQPYGPYDAGDLWAQGHNNTNDGAIFRCQTPTAIPNYFAAGDWVPAADYESVKISRANFDVFADAIVGTVAQYDSEGRITSEFATRIAQTIDSISFSVAKVSSALLPTGIDITNQQIVVTANNFMIRDNDSNVALITEGNKIKAAYLEINGIFSTTPGSVWMTNVNSLNQTAFGYANTAEGNAKSYADTGDTNTLNSAKSYADTVAETAYDDALDYVTDSVIPGVTRAYTDAINALGVPDLASRLGTAEGDIDGLEGNVSDLSGDLDAAILRIQATEGGLSDLGYLSAALLNGQTVAVGGLVLSSLIQLGSTTGPSASWQVWSGINGVYNSSVAGNGIAAWYGGAMLDRYYSENTDANRAAKTLFRMDGSGYLASNNLWWGASGELHLSQSTIIGSNPSDTIDSLVSAVAQIASWFEVADYTTGGQTIHYLRLKTSATGISGLATDGFISAGGVGPGGGGGGGGLVEQIYRIENFGGTFSASANDTFNAYAINSLHLRISDLERAPGGVTSVAGLTGAVSASDLFTALGLGSAARLAVGSIVDGNTGLVTGGDVYSFVNSSVATATAEYKGNFNVVSDLGLAYNASRSDIEAELGQTIFGADNNDYCFVEIPTSASDPTQLARIERYKYNGTSWAYEYVLNNSSFTAAQWAAINSGITTTKVSLIDGLNTRVGVLEARINWDDYLGIDNNGNIFVKKNGETPRGFYSFGFITAGGVGSGGGGGGGGDLDVNTMYINLANGEGADPLYFTREINVSHLHEFWKSLQNNDIVSTYDNYKIAGAHIPDMAETYGYLKSADIDAYLQSLQSQIDSVAARTNFDDLVVTSLFSDVASISSLYAETIYLGGTSIASSLSSLASRATTLEGYFDANGNAKSALKLTTVSKTIWGQTYWTSGGVPQNVTAAPNLYIGGSKVQTSQAAQALVGISSISAVVSPESDDETKIEWDANANAWHFHGGIYADTFVTAGGVGSGGSVPTTLDAVWNTLRYNTGDYQDVQIDLAHIPGLPWSKIISGKPSSLSGYGILDAYTKTEVDNLIGAIDQFHYEIYPSLSDITTPAGNVLYLIGPTGSGSDKYEEYVYANGTFTKIGDTTIDLSAYLTIASAQATYQPIISDLSTIRTQAGHGETAYNSLGTISDCLQSIQSQIDSVATRNDFDELNASSVFSDIVAATSLYVGSIALGGNDLATTLSNLSGRIGTVEGKFTGDSANSALRLAGTSAYSIWGVEYWSSGVPKSVTGRPGLFIGSTQVQTSSATQDLAGIGSITATGALTLSSTKKIYFGDSAHYIELDSNGCFHFSHGLYSDAFVTAGGQGTGGGGGGGLVEQIYRIGNFGDTFDTNANDTFNAYAINSLHLRIASLEQDHGVTYVGLSMPTGFSVSSSPITASGTLSVSFASGYSLLTSTQISTWNGKQDAIRDLDTIRTNATNGATAYGWGNHANAGYFAASSFTASNIVSTLGNTAVNRATADTAGENIASNFTTVGNALKSLQSQIDSVASRSVYDELTATNLYSDMAVGVSAYFSNFYGNLTGTASNATNADNADKLDGVHASGLFTELTTSAGSTNLYITIGGTRLSKTIYAYYDSDGGVIASNMTTIGTALRSLQSQIDSVATNRSFDEISITSAFINMLSVGSNVNVGGTIHSVGGIDSNSYITAGATGSSSDARLKDNIVEVSTTRALQLLSALKGEEWTWNSKKEYLAGKHGSGLIAQEVLPVMPWAVLDLNGEYSLNYNTLWGVAIPVMQSHEQRIEALERENKELKRKIEMLTNNS